MHAPKAHIPVATLIGIAAVAAGVGGALGTVATRMLGWPEAADAMVPSFLGAGVVLVVGVFAALAMHLFAAGDETRVANALLAGTGMRLMGVLFGGLIVSLVISQDRPMWLGLLFAGVLALMLDTLVLLKAAGATGRTSSSSPTASSRHGSSGANGPTVGVEKQTA